MNGSESSRREFLGGLSWVTAGAMTAGCVSRSMRSGSGSMANFAVAPMKTIHVGFIGIGERGMAAVHRVMLFPNVEATALCDLRVEAVDEAAKWLRENKKPGAMREYKGTADAWKRVCDDPAVDVVYIVTPATLHVEMATYAMEAGKHVMVEVPGAQTIEDCWRMVETCEKTRRHCLMLENCCYGEDELLAWEIVHKGLLGTLTHAEGAYIHDLCWRHLEDSFRTKGHKAGEVIRRYGNGYPTHPLGPICLYMDMNRGDRMERIVSLSSCEAAHSEFAAATYGADAWQNNIQWQTGDMNTSIIRTAKGRTIMLQHDLSTPRPYSRINLIQGSKGFFRSFPENAPQATFAKKPGGDAMGWKDKEYELYEGERFKELREKYGHPLWRRVGQAAKTVGGHGGMDFIMDLRWIYCLQNGLPLDMDVYDLASWSAIVPCSAESDMNGGIPVAIPDFTRGAWRLAKPAEIGDVDLEKMGFDPSMLKKDDKQLSV